MQGNELQYGLIGLGTLLVLAIVIYNVWQERKARKHAEQVFRSTHRDVLLDEQSEPVIPPAPGGRMEPSLPGRGGIATEEPSAVEEGEQPASVPPPAMVRGGEPGLPWELQAIDCAVVIEAPAGVSASALFNGQQTLLANLSKPLRWYGWNESGNRWVLLDARTDGSLNRACACLQLVDARGAIAESELERFYDQVQRMCDQFLAVPRLPVRAEVMARAAEIDRFCQEVDIQIAVNVITRETPFAGTKIRSLAEAAGMNLRADGSFHAQDDAQLSLFTLSNLEAALFSAEQLRQLSTHGITLVMDLPRAPKPYSTFARMIDFAMHLADGLGGQVVDDNRAPLSDRSLAMIRTQVSQFEQHMERQAIPAGSEIARRLFA